MIHCVSGRPGGGKSLYGMRLLVDELRRGNRAVFTNLPVKLGPLAEYLSAQGVVGIDRVNLLDDGTQTRWFWRYRPEGKIQGVDDPKEWTGGKRPDFSLAKQGVLYIIDEVHLFFGSREWAETGKEAIFYLSQHRKLGDDVVIITQHVEHVDKQFRNLAQDFTYLRNLASEQWFGFRGLSRFVRSTYLRPANSEHVKPSEVGTFTLDVVGLASCYDTAAGVSVLSASGADKGKKKRGLPPWLALLAIPLFILLIVGGAKLAGGLFSRFLKGAAESGQQFTNSVSAVTNHPPATGARSGVTIGAPEPLPARRVEPAVPVRPAEADEVFAVGVTCLPGGVPEVMLSDGTTRAGVLAKDGSGVMLRNGKFFKWRRTSPSASSLSTPARVLGSEPTAASLAARQTSVPLPQVSEDRNWKRNPVKIEWR